MGALVRIVREPTGALVPGAGRPGRGAWLCASSPQCLSAAARRGAFVRALRVPIAPDAPDALAALLYPGNAALPGVGGLKAGAVVTTIAAEKGI